jgi:hypothetical protein
MAGRTGKMTAEALAARGPRMVLGEVRLPNDRSFVVIYREGQEPFRSGDNSFRLFTWAKSYTLSYLLKIGRSMKWIG